MPLLPAETLGLGVFLKGIEGLCIPEFNVG